MNESFQLVFETDDATDKQPDFSPLQTYFTLLDTNRSSQISIVNGHYQRSVKWTLQLMPKQVGDIIVPAIDFGQEKTKPFQIAVKSASTLSHATGGGLMLELTADQDSVAVQEQVIVTLRLFSDSNITNYEFGDLVIENMDVVVEPLGDVKQFQTRLGTKAYLVFERQFALFPQTSGTMVINPVLGKVRLPAASRSIFDPFQARGEVRSAYSAELTLTVTGIHTVFNGQHWLPAKRLVLNEDWQHHADRLVAGEPITRTVTLTATGLTSAQLPTIQQVAVVGIKQYPDQAVVKDHITEQGIVGVKKQKIALIPTTAGTYHLPSLSIAWWNTQTGQQAVASLPARTIKVAEAVITPSAAVANITESSPVTVVNQTNPFWIGLSLFLALGWLISFCVGWWYYRRTLPSDQSPTQTLSDRRQARKRLQQACADNDAVTAREALLAWAQTLEVGITFTHLNQLSHYFGEPLKSHIHAMNESLYSRDAKAWQGQALWQACRLIRGAGKAEGAVRSGSLLALNP